MTQPSIAGSREGRGLCTMYITPCTMHLAPFTMHLAPFTMHLALFTMYLAPCPPGRCGCTALSTPLWRGSGHLRCLSILIKKVVKPKNQIKKVS